MTTEVCPRCGKAVIEVKDMGLCGKLLIHHYIDTPVGPAPFACRITTTELKNGVAWTVPQSPLGVTKVPAKRRP